MWKNAYSEKRNKWRNDFRVRRADRHTTGDYQTGSLTKGRGKFSLGCWEREESGYYFSSVLQDGFIEVVVMWKTILVIFLGIGTKYSRPTVYRKTYFGSCFSLHSVRPKAGYLGRQARWRRATHIPGGRKQRKQSGEPGRKTFLRRTPTDPLLSIRPQTLFQKSFVFFIHIEKQRLQK